MEESKPSYPRVTKEDRTNGVDLGNKRLFCVPGGWESFYGVGQLGVQIPTLLFIGDVTLDLNILSINFLINKLGVRATPSHRVIVRIKGGRIFKVLSTQKPR